MRLFKIKCYIRQAPFKATASIHPSTSLKMKTLDWELAFPTLQLLARKWMKSKANFFFFYFLCTFFAFFRSMIIIVDGSFEERGKRKQLTELKSIKGAPPLQPSTKWLTDWVSEKSDLLQKSTLIRHVQGNPAYNEKLWLQSCVRYHQNFIQIQIQFLLSFPIFKYRYKCFWSWSILMQLKISISLMKIRLQNTLLRAKVFQCRNQLIYPSLTPWKWCSQLFYLCLKPSKKTKQAG